MDSVHSHPQTLGSCAKEELLEVLKPELFGRIRQTLGDDKNRILQRTESRVARFIYRGFHDTSGGGNPLLNTEQGVTAHAFLPGNPPMPESMRDLSSDTLSCYVTNHLSNPSPAMHTPFSSWSPDIATALYFATGRFPGHHRLSMDPKSCFIAVLDTWTMFTNEERPYRIVPVGLIGQPRCGCEYMVYGPVGGPAYIVVSIYDIQEAVGCSSWPYCPTRSPMPHSFTPGELQEALNMSKLFNRSNAMQLTVFLAENCRQQWNSPKPGLRDNKLIPLLGSKHLNWDQNFEELAKMMVFLSGCTELVQYKDTLPLFNWNTDALGMGQLQLAVSSMVVTAHLLGEGFEPKDIQNMLATEFREIREKTIPFLRPQGHTHDCEDCERRHTMSLEVAHSYRSAFLNTLDGPWNP